MLPWFHIKIIVVFFDYTKKKIVINITPTELYIYLWNSFEVSEDVDEM